jgi:Secretion system C-terminal sorting domain
VVLRIEHLLYCNTFLYVLFLWNIKLTIMYKFFTLVFLFLSTATIAQIPATGNILWLKADAGVYTDLNITLATSGQTVQSWRDQSGSANDLKSSSPQPTFETGRLNNKPVLKFVTNQIMISLNSLNLSGTDKQDIFIVYASSATTSTPFTIQGNVSTIFYDRAYIKNQFAIVSGLSNTSSVSISQVSSTITSDCYKIVESRNDLSLTTNENSLYINGVAIAPKGTDPNTNSTGNFNALSRIRVGDGGTTELDVAEIIVYNRILNASEKLQVETYLNTKYFTGDATAQFTGLTTAAQVVANTSLDDAIWKHTYLSTQSTKIITSVKDNCANLGTLNSTVYNDATATLNGGQYTMRRHFTIKPTLNPAGAKRVRLYYSNADFADLQTVVPSLTSASQLVVTKYTGPNEDGVYNTTGGTLTFIPSAQIITGTAYGANYLEFDVTGFSEFWIHTGTSALPLHFLSFTAQKCTDKNVCLSWQTANEENVSHFEIERSMDGKTFTKVGIANANNHASNSYTSNDDIALMQNENKVYYRIKQIDVDGKFTYTDIKSVKINSKKEVIIYPTPAKDVVTIDRWYDIKYMELYDMSGRKLKIWQAVQPTINISNIANGNYLLRVVLKSNKILQEKILKY